MKKLFTLSILLIFCTACKKKTFTETYTGSCTVSYDHSELNNSTGQLTQVKWDSSYTDEIIVIKNYQDNTITFELHVKNYLFANSKTSYSFPLNQNNYSEIFSTHSAQTFNFSSDSLYRYFYSYGGFGTNYSSTKLSFGGVK